MTSVGGILGLLLIIGIISTCSGNVRCDEEVMPTTIELPEDNPYNLPDIAIEEDGKKMGQPIFPVHFILYQGSLHRSKYEEMLSGLLGFSYSKKSGVSTRMFNALLPKQPEAIRYAQIVMKQFDGKNPAQEESSTTVYQLVVELNKYL